MPTLPHGYYTSTDMSAKMVQHYAPLLRGGLPLPSYRQPAITWEITPACVPDFAALIRTVWARLDLTDRTQFTEDECLVLQYQRMHGLGKLYRKGLTVPAGLLAPEVHKAHGVRLQADIANLLGDKLLALLGPAQVARWFPWNDVAVWPGTSERAWTLRCTSLVPQVTADGRPFYYSAKKPTVTLRGKRRIVAFSPHAIQRIAERLVWSPSSYADLGDIFAFLNDCQYFEPARLHPHHDAFALFQHCTHCYWSAAYAEAILDHLDPQACYAYRVGYCPVVEEGDFFLAKTVLVPGHVGTPEYGVLLKASLEPGVKEQMLEQCHAHSYQTLGVTQDFAVLRWFHTHGVPQVITCTQPLFDYGD
jgi:hypothetical protein